MDAGDRWGERVLRRRRRIKYLRDPCFLLDPRHQRVLRAQTHLPVTDIVPGQNNRLRKVRYAVVGMLTTLTRRLPSGADPQLGRRRGAQTMGGRGRGAPRSYSQSRRHRSPSRVRVRDDVAQHIPVVKTVRGSVAMLLTVSSVEGVTAPLLDAARYSPICPRRRVESVRDATNCFARARWPLSSWSDTLW